ncbi:MAG: hypothetical protein ACK5ZX_01820, partial [Bacteroidota bacterium]
EYAVPLKFADLDNIKQADIAKKLNLSLSAEYSGQTEPLNPGQTEPLNPGQTEPVIPVKLSHSFRSN